MSEPGAAVKAEKAAAPAARRANAQPARSAEKSAVAPAPFQSAAGNFAVQSLLRGSGVPARPTISRPDDPDEREADRAARHFEARGIAGFGVEPPSRGSGGHEARQERPSSLTGSTGHELPKHLRKDFERYFATDLSATRIHDDKAAHDTTGAVNAHAFTHGSHVYFAPNRFDPQSSHGRELLAHELTHVVQQRRAAHSVQRQEAPGATPNSSAQGIPPVTPPAIPTTVPNKVEVEVPVVSASGDPHPKMQKRQIALQEPVVSSATVIYYAVPRSAISNAKGPLTQEEINALNAGQAPGSTPAPVLSSGSAPNTSTAAPAPAPPPAKLGDLGQVLVSGDYLITTRYTKFAVGAGSVALVDTAKGVTLIDAGVGALGRAELTTQIMNEIGRLVGDRPIQEILVTHLHGDHTSLLPELARRFEIGKIRLNLLQLRDPAMIELLEKTANAQRERIIEQMKKDSAKNRAAWEADPKSGPVITNPADRDAAWAVREQQLIQEKIAKSGIKIETLVPKDGVFQVSTQQIGELTIPEAEGKPVLLKQGLLETDSGATNGPRTTTAYPEISQDIRKLADTQATDPKARPESDVVDRNESTFVIEMSGGARLLVLPDKRAPDIKKMKDLLLADVARLNAALAKMGRAPARLQVWEMSHHLQRGFITDIGQMESMIESLHQLTRVELPQGGKTIDIMVVSGQAGAGGKNNLLDPAIAWFLEQNGIRVHVATAESIKLLEVVTPSGQKIAGIAAGAPYLGGAGQEATLRQSQTAIEHIKRQQSTLNTGKPPVKGTPAEERRKAVQEIDAKIADLGKLLKEIEAARKAYLAELEKSQRPAKQGDAAPAPPEAGSPMQQKLLELQSKLTDPRLQGMAIEGPAGSAVFDPVALYVIKEPTGGFSAQQKAIVEAFQQADALREKLKAKDSLETRAELTEQLTKLRAALEAYIKDAPPGTKEVLTERLAKVNADLDIIAGKATQETVKTSQGEFTVENRVTVGKADSPAAKRVEAVTEGANRALGAVMIYSLVKSQNKLAQDSAMGDISGLESIVGTTHNALGMTIGVRMMAAKPVAPGEMVLLSVLDIFQTATHRHDTQSEHNAALAFSVIRNGLQLGFLLLGHVLAKTRHPVAMAVGFAVQFLVDPILNFLGVYDRLERSFDFYPNSVAGVKQKLLRDLLREYTVIVGLMSLQERSSLPLGLNANDTDARKQINDSLKESRAKALDSEKKVLEAFAQAYEEARTSYAGLPELDMMRQRFVLLQEQVRRTDSDNAPASRKAMQETFDRIDAAASLEGKTVEEIHELAQWRRIEGKIKEVRGAVKVWNWQDASKFEGELNAMLRNARYRLDPSTYGFRTQSMLPASGAITAAYKEELQKWETEAANLHVDIVKQLGGPDPGPAPAAGSQDAGEFAVRQAEAAMQAYRKTMDAQPALEGVSPAVLRGSSYQAGPAYATYLEKHPAYASGLLKLELAEQVMVAMREAANIANTALLAQPTSDVRKERVEALGKSSATMIKERKETRGYLFAWEAKELVSQLRTDEKLAIANQVGDTSLPLSPQERLALGQTDVGNQVATDTSVADRIEEVPALTLADSDGYMVGVYRYVDGSVSREKNVLLGDTGKVEHMATTGDNKLKHRVYVCLNEAARKHFTPGFNVPAGYAYLQDTPFNNEVKNLERIKLSELTK